MELSADELRFKLFKLHQDGITIPDYEQMALKLREFAEEMGDTRKDLDYWCERLKELEICRKAIESMDD